MRKYFIFLSLLILASCRDSSSLGSGYYYLDSYEAMDIGYPYGSIIYKSQKKLWFEDVIIQADIEMVKNDKRYITVVQKPNKSKMKERLSDEIDIWNRYQVNKEKKELVFPHGKVATSIFDKTPKKDFELAKGKFLDSVMETENYYIKLFRYRQNYYIIDKATGVVMGPLTKSDFKRTSAKLDIR